MGQPSYRPVLVRASGEGGDVLPQKHLDSLELYLSQYRSEWKSAHIRPIDLLCVYT